MKHKFSICRYEPEFRTLWLGYTFTILGGWFSTIAVNLFVWNTYESAILSALSLIINMVPTVVLGPILGRYVDKLDKRFLAIGMSLLNGIILICPIIFPNIYTICLFNFFNGVILCIRYPWINSYIPLLVKKEHLADANAAITLSKTSGQLLMPLLSGGLFVATSSTILFLFNVLFLIFAMIAFLNLPKRREDKYTGASQNGISVLLQGVRNLLWNKNVSPIACLMMAMLFLDGGINLLLIMVTKNIFHISDFYYGVLTTIQGLGMTLASIGVVKWIVKLNISNVKLLYYLGFINIIMIFLLGHITHFSVFLLVVFCEAYVWIVMTILEKYLIQSVVLPLYRATTFAVYGSLCWLSSSIGTLVFGYLTENLAISTVVTIETMAIFVITIILYGLTRGVGANDPGGER